MIWNNDSSLSSLISLLFKMLDSKIQKSFKLCLAREKLEFQETLTQAVSSHAYWTV